MASAKALARSAEMAPAVPVAAGEHGESGAAGNETFEVLFHRHYRTVYGVLLRLVDSPEEAEDLAQDVFLRLHQRGGGLSDDEVPAWLYRVALNTGFNAIRSRRRSLQRLLRWARLEPALARGVEGPEAEVAARDEAARVRQALDGLRERERAVLALRASGVSYAEIAAAVGIKPSSVGTTLARAERALRERYEALTPGEDKEGANGA